MTEPLVRCVALGRDYGRRRALDALDLEVRPGEIVGLVGPNGSGKTTLLKLLAGLLRPTRGTARVLGLDPARDRARVMRAARFAFAPPALWERLTAREHLVHLSAVGGPPASAADVAEVLETVGLSDRADERVRAFSFGMRQRLALAQALLPRPALLVLDEPTDGLDPLAVLELRAVLRDLRDRHGVGVLLSSHLLVEVEELVDALVVLHEGRALHRGSPRELLRAGESLRIRVDAPDAARAALAARGVPARAVAAPGELELDADGLDLEAVRAIVAERGAVLTACWRHRPTLEEVLVERLRRARAEEAP